MNPKAQLLTPYPPMTEVKDPYPGMVVLVQNGDLYQLQEVISIEDGKAVMAPIVRPS